jgi:hypothetical protein
LFDLELLVVTDPGLQATLTQRLKLLRRRLPALPEISPLQMRFHMDAEALDAAIRVIEKSCFRVEEIFRQAAGEAGEEPSRFGRP